MKSETKSTVLLKHHLKALKLPTVLAECEKVAQRCSAENVDHLGFLLQVVELELIERERKAAERRLKAARFPTPKTLDEFDFAARVILQELLRGLDEVGVEPAAETFVRRHQSENQSFAEGAGHAAFALVTGQQRIFVIRRPASRVPQNLHHLMRVGTRGDNALLRAAKPRRGDHLHRLRDLLHVLDGAHPPPEVL